MTRFHWYIVAIVLILVVILIDICFDEILPIGINYALGTALGYMIGACYWNARNNRKKE